MPATIVDTDAWSTVQRPIDGEHANGSAFALSAQSLTNRTRYLRNRHEELLEQYESLLGQHESLLEQHELLLERVIMLQSHARFAISAPLPGVASGSKLTLSVPQSVPLNPGNHYSILSNSIAVPGIGTYLVSAVLRMACSAATEPLAMTALITAGTSPDGWGSNRLVLGANRTDNGHAEFASVTGLITISNHLTERISILSGVSNIIVDDELVESHRMISIHRIT